MQSPFSRITGSLAEQVIPGDEKKDNEKNGEQGTAQKEGKQHADCNPKQNKTDYFSHEYPPKTPVLL